ncbi:hypothetical protein UlMin_029730 [Ulmus minor]
MGPAQTPKLPTPQPALVGAGIFVETQYIPRLAEISDLVHLRAIWSRSKESARGAVEIAQKYFPGVECKWGDKGLDEIIEDNSILGVAVVLAGQAQVDFSIRLLKAGKHVLQEKPVAASTSELEAALASYDSISAQVPGKPIWAVAENYRFESAFVEVLIIIEGSMNSPNPYFSSSWRLNFNGGFILDMGVHFVAGLRMLVGCEVASASAITSHVDKTLPPPDNISSVFQLENGCSGVFVQVISSNSPQIFWRVVGLKGTLQIERGKQDGKQGYLVSFYGADGQSKNSFYTFSGVTEEFKSFIHDISQASVKGARDVAVLQAMLESGTKQGAQVQVKKF